MELTEDDSTWSLSALIAIGVVLDVCVCVSAPAPHLNAGNALTTCLVNALGAAAFPHSLLAVDGSIDPSSIPRVFQLLGAGLMQARTC